jgi:PilZ domain-containing protein
LTLLSSEEIVSTSAQHFADPGQVHERRLHPRIFPKTLVYVACGAANGGMVLNASDGGLAISMAIAVGGDSFSNMLVRMNGLPQAIEASGRIVWTNVSRKRAGIQLLDVNDTQRMKISEWLAYEGVREVHLVLQEAPRIVVPVAPVFDESRYSLLQAFGGSAPESLGPVPSLVDQFPDQQETHSSSANTEMQPIQDFTSEAQTGFRDNEWDLADVTLIPRKKSTRAGLPAYALIFLWIAIPCFGIGMLVGRRPIEQWLARGDANGKSVTEVMKPVSASVSDGARTQASANIDTPETSTNQDAMASRVHVDATTYTVSDSSVASPLPQDTSVTLLNSLSTQELRAIKKSNVAITSPQAPTTPYLAAANPKPPSASSFQATKPAEVPAPAATAPAVVAPAVAAASVRKPDNFATAVARNVQPANAASKVPAQQNYDERMPKTLSVDSGLTSRSTTKISTPGNAHPAAPATTAPAPVSAMTARSAPVTSTPSPAPRSLSASSPNPAPARPVSPSASPSIAPVLPQPPLHGMMHVARKSDESFLLKLPLESVSGDHNTAIRMQRFVLVPKQSRWHRHGPIVKLTIGELLRHDAPDAPRAMNAAAGDVITVRAYVDENGAVEDLKPVSGRFALLPRVMRAVRDWQFDRTLLDGKPVESEVNITMEFRPTR